MTSFLAHSISLTLVLCHAGVYVLNNVSTDRSLQDSWHGNGRNNRVVAIVIKDGDNWTRGHGCYNISKNELIYYFEIKFSLNSNIIKLWMDELRYFELSFFFFI